ncbi:Plasmodium exported protein (Pm-fam-a like), unknown function [Plasmodium malariae]|uniref:Fam-l protein n=1 Tax=Plasmodium malariae TaxID=5858 RepID=A0A1A8X1J0_PLAMA|nr:Plasmodium exported protein (Pm-fam-a like), unknown function [Plasmodium malariae]
MFNKPMEKKYKFHRKIDTGNYRLLAKYKKNKDSIITGLNEKVPYNKLNEKKDIYNNEKWETGYKELSSTSSSKKVEVNKKAMKNKSCIFETKKYSSMEKKIFKELDYQNFLKNNRTISDKTYKTIISKKYGLRLAIPVLLFLSLFIVFIVDFSLGFKTKVAWEGGLFGLWSYIKEFSIEGSWLEKPLQWLRDNTPGFWRHYGVGKNNHNLCDLCTKASKHLSENCILGQLFGYIIYFVPFIILGITLISWIIYFHKKVKKYEQIKFRKR